MRIGFAQINPTVGDLRGNCEKIAAAYGRLAEAGAELVITPELAITGYPPQDLVFKSRFVPENLEVLGELQGMIGRAALLVGFVARNEGRGKPFHNAAALLQHEAPMQTARKALLPTYDVFDEARYFESDCEMKPLMLGHRKIGVTICEDIWTEPYLPRPYYNVEPVRALVEQGAELIVNLSASPFTLGKARVRREMVSSLAREHQVPICYCNAVGGNDQLLFDGESIAVNRRGELVVQLAAFEEQEAIIDPEDAAVIPVPERETMADLSGALTLGVRDYMRKCNFKTAVLGLSGGIDSAVVAAIAVEALGAENVTGVSMPSPYSSPGSIDDALALSRNLGIKCLQMPIGDALAAFKAQFTEVFAGLPEDTTEENMQSRLRGMILMSLSNKFGHILLTTGNKSELAVGYCTIYGDMAGGLAVISDVPKTMVYELARWMNSDKSRAGREREVIPWKTIEKPPSAELKPGQVDQDTLPPYETLDEILRLYVEENLSARDIAARGFEEKTVRWIQRRVDLNEYKREQAAPGIKVTSRAFGVGRRMPIAQGYPG
ncbi:NAD+ synthase [soil metagenome]